MNIQWRKLGTTWKKDFPAGQRAVTTGILSFWLPAAGAADVATPYPATTAGIHVVVLGGLVAAIGIALLIARVLAAKAYAPPARPDAAPNTPEPPRPPQEELAAPPPSPPPPPATTSAPPPAPAEPLRRAPATVSANRSVKPIQRDDSATKIDLAFAYCEMGDTRRAQTLVEDVLHNGNEKQCQLVTLLRSRIEKGAIQPRLGTSILRNIEHRNFPALAGTRDD